MLGNHAQGFSRSIRVNIKVATECLITIKDIISAMTMIRRVLRDQGRAPLSLRETMNSSK